MIELVGLSVERGVATLRLDRAEKRNAVNHEMWEAIGGYCQRLASDADVRVLVVRGVGDHFCAGADIGGLSRANTDYGEANRAAEASLAAFPKPTIAFIRGSCVGGGVQIATACDLRLADRTARFGITPARLGLVYPTGALQRVVALIGPAATKHLLFSAELIDAERALRIGLVDEVHEPDEAEARLLAFTRLLAEERSLLTQEASKAMIDAIVATGRVGDELVARWSAELAASDDVDEGVSAFLERRVPRFTWTGDSSASRGGRST
jgi:enoyl-CoA hydratase/carnithine racemase